MLCSCAVGGKFFFLGYASITKKSPQTGTALARSRENCTLYTSWLIWGSHSKGLMTTGLIGAGYGKRLNFSAAESSPREECGGRMGGERAFAHGQCAQTGRMEMSVCT